MSLKNLTLFITTISILLINQFDSKTSEKTDWEVTTTQLEANAKAFEGKYYFKGMRIMTITKKDNYYIPELYGEQEDHKGNLIWYSYPLDYESMGINKPLDVWPVPEHKAKLVEPTLLKFKEFPFTFNNYVDYLDLPNSDQINLEENSDILPFDPNKLYYERWRMLEGGRLQIECLFPVTIKSFYLHTPKSIEKLVKEIEDNGYIINVDDYKKVCAWKLVDPREVEGWNELEKDNFANAAKLFKATATTSPNNPFAKIGEAYALTGLKEYNNARVAIKAAEERLNNETRQFLIQQIAIVKDQIDAYEIANSNNDMVKLLEQIDDNELELRYNEQDNFSLSRFLYDNINTKTPEDFHDLHKRFKAFKHWELLRKAVKKKCRPILMPLNQKSVTYRYSFTENNQIYHKIFAVSKLMIARGHLERKSGNIEKAISFYAQSVSLGRKFKTKTIMSQVWGSAIENKSMNALLQLVEDNKINNKAALNKINGLLSYYDSGRTIPTIQDLFLYENFNRFPLSTDPMVDTNFINVPSVDEFIIRAKVPSVKFDILKTAIELKNRQRDGFFPSEINSSYHQPDIFNEGEKLKVKTKHKTATVYSYGPDKDDDHAAIIYDPTNGTISNGDIILNFR